MENDELFTSHDNVMAGEGWVTGAGAMLHDLGIVPEGRTNFTLPAGETMLGALTELWKRQNHQNARLDLLDAALDRLFPGWRMGRDACLPNCQGACCET